ncbi:carbon-nitrogen hydrolase [Aquamicrobium defluvii]|uniref:Carbon-nitrogen hydrolase n=2 Tax=Aquamicrobium defluvii TaxID=69279 RepID=A0A4R6Y7C2_9HYPH|nr:conjugal transfer protein TraB [Aquamicrobium defluvii]TDR31216.1 carbon-nitrogen hydrolase [Aquamicrobium defluvii]
MAAAVGVVAWSGEPLLLPVAMLFPAFWAFAPSRIGAVLVSAGYFLAASRGLPQGVANFYGAGIGAGLALWVSASAGFVLVHTMLWTERPGWRRALRYGVVAVLMSVPPFGIVGWAHPITGAGMVFSGWGWPGLVAAMIGLLAMTMRFWPIATLTMAGLCLWSAANWMPPDAPESWAGIDTRFRGENGQYADYAQQVETIGLVMEAADNGARFVVLPESAAGIWTPTTARLWSRALDGGGLTVIAGAIIVDAVGYDNVMVEISGKESRILYRERMPVPVSMWQPWLAFVGEPAGARAHFFANPAVEIDGVRIAPLICYEQLIIWPILQSASHNPDVIIATGNGWWTENTNIVAIQWASATAWARLFSLPLIVSFNT